MPFFVVAAAVAGSVPPFYKHFSEIKMAVQAEGEAGQKKCAREGCKK